MKRGSTSVLVCLLVVILITLTQVDGRRPVITFVTALWDVKRGHFKNSQRSYEGYYLRFYKELLQTDNNLIAFGDSRLKEFTLSNRRSANTIFIEKQLSEIQKYWYTPKIWSANRYFQQHAQQFDWEHMSGLSHYGLKMYNPVVMSKLFFMREASQRDPFGSDYLVWTDAGLTHAISKQFLYRHSLDKIVNYYEIDWFFLANKKWDWDSMQKGFRRNGDVYRVENPSQIVPTSCWANWFGGKVQALSTVLSIYENMLRITLQRREMSTDESVFTFMLQRYPYILTKLDTDKPDKFVSFETDYRSHYQEEKVQRSFRLGTGDEQEPIQLSTSAKSIVMVSAVTYQASIYAEIRAFYEQTLFLRVLMLVLCLLAYGWIKMRYLRDRSHSQDILIAISATEDS